MSLLHTDAPTPPTEREVAGLNLPDQEMEARRSPDGIRVGETASKEQLDPTGGSSFPLGEGLPPIPAKLVAKIQKGDYVDMAKLLQDNMEAERRRGASTSRT